MPLKLIQVGLGAHGRSVGAHIARSPDFEYVGLVDLDLEAARLFVAEHALNPTLIYSDYEQAFRELEADAVFIAAASAAHYELGRAALENDLHVLVEKPFVLSLEDGMSLVELAARRRKILMVDQNYRFFETTLTLKKAIQDQILGQPLFIQLQFYYNHNGKPYQKEMADYMLLEMAVHHLDLMRFVLDSDIQSVYATTWNYPDSGYKGDPNVNAAYQTERGVRVFYTGSLLAPGRATPWEGLWRVQCERGALHLDDLGEGFGVYATEDDGPATRIAAFKPDLEGFAGVLAEFTRSIQTGDEPGSSGRDNLQTLAALFATSRSAREGQTITIKNRRAGL